MASTKAVKRTPSGRVSYRGESFSGYNKPKRTSGGNKKFVLGIDRAKMRLYDVEDTAQTLNVRDEPPKVSPRYDKIGEGFN